MKQLTVGVIFVCLTMGLHAQVYDLTKVVARHIDPIYVQDLQLHAINASGTVLASVASVHDPRNRQVLLISHKQGSFRVEQLAEIPNCELMDLSDQGIVLLNATLPPATVVRAYTLSRAKNTEPKLVYPYGEGSSQAARIHGQRVALQVQFERLPDISNARDNPFRESSSELQAKKSAKRGMIRDLESGEITTGGFPAANWYNLTTDIADFNDHGHFCGQSKGYTLGENVDAPYPYLALKDTIHRLLDGYRGKTVAMNNKDQVIGTWKHPLTGKDYGFFYDTDLSSDMEYDWLDLLLAIPNAITNDGIVVGQQTDTAFVMIEKEFVPKSQVLPEIPSTWKVTRLIDINDRLEVIGEALFADRRLLFFSKLQVPD